MTEKLIHNPRNAVTHSIERITFHGRRAVRKVLNGTNAPDTPAEWMGSAQPRHWNYWQRESLVYQNDLREQLRESGIRLPELLSSRDTADDKIELILEDVQGRSGVALTLDDYALVCRSWGRAQAKLFTTAWKTVWTSNRFLRDYSMSKPVNYQLLYDESAWLQPLIVDNWPNKLRDQLIALYENRNELYEIVESSMRVPSHLDFWPNNVIVDKAGIVVPIDWSFYGDGAVGEDISNFIPDAVFDGFVGPDTLPEMERFLFNAYLDGLDAGGLNLNPAEIVKSFHACAVKYVWLGPLLLQKAAEGIQRAYGGDELTDANKQYRNRGKALSYICKWARLALTS